jgi:hypothetical protein
MPEFLANSTFIFWAAIVLICVVPTISYHWYKIRRAEMDTALKQDMLQRGMSAEQIKTVLEASSHGEGTGCRRSAARTAREADQTAQ